MQPKSLQQRLSIYLILPVALLLIFIGFVGYIYARDLLLTQWREASVLKLERAAHQVDMRLMQVKEWIRVFQETVYDGDVSAVHTLSIRQLKRQESVDDVRFSFNSDAEFTGERSAAGMSGMGRHAGRFPTKRGFHGGRIRGFSPPVFEDTIDHQTVSVISDLTDEKGMTVGQLEVVLNFDLLIKNIRESGWWQSNKAYLVDDRGSILASTAGERRGSLADSDDPLERKILNAMRSHTYKTVLGRGHPPKEVSGFFRLKEAPWNMVMIAPGKAILAPIVRFRSYYFAIGSGFIVLIVILLRMVTGRTVTAIRQVSCAAQRVANGDYGSPLEVKTRDEVGELIRSFNSMVQQLKERLEMKYAMNLAMEVQQNLLPKTMPQIKGLDIAAQSIYCDETGGDLYDILEFQDQNADRIGIVVGDVSGHGIPAALLMASVRAFLKSRVNQPGSSAEIISDVNRLVTNDTGETGQFVTLFYASLDMGRKEMHWIRAGHEPAVCYDRVTDSVAELRGEGIALGVDPDYAYREGGRIRLSKGQLLLIGTDGLWEMQNDSGEMFGKSRLEATIRQNSWGSASEILKSITEAVQYFRGSAKQEDDITLAVINVTD